MKRPPAGQVNFRLSKCAFSRERPVEPAPFLGSWQETACRETERAFVEEEAAQCGYCMNGVIMTAKVLAR
jgi:hypothetical protein